MKKFFALLVAFLGTFYFSANAQTCDPNIDLELGNYTNWSLMLGTCCPISTPSVTTSPGTRFTITSGTSTDPCCSFPVVGAGVYSLQIGNNSGTYHSQKAIFNVHVPAGSGNYSLIYRYAFVLQDPGHSPASQPRMTIQAFDSATGTTIPTMNYNFIAGSVPGTYSGSGSSCMSTTCKSWTTQSADLSGHNGSTIRVEFTTADCGLGGHFGYGYIDMSCGLFITSLYSGCGGSSVQLFAPSGFSTYAWYDPSSFTTLYGTTASITVPVLSTLTSYAVIVTPASGYGNPDTLYTTVNPAVCSGTPIPGIVSSTYSTVCLGQSFTLTNSGFTGTSHQWQSSPDSITWNNISGATNSSYVSPGISATTYFRCKDSCCASGLIAATPGLKITATVCCSGTPAAGTASASTSYCSSCSLTLNLTGFTTSPDIGFQWQYSSDNISWSNLAGATTVPYTYNPINAYYYRCKVTCTSSSLSSYSSSVFVAYQYHIIADSIVSPPDTMCSTPKFYVKVNGASSLLDIKTYFGDGTNNTLPLTSIGTTASYLNASHFYSSPGCYTIKQVLYCNTVPIDSITFVYHQIYCNIFSIKFYLDANNNCIKDATEPFSTSPVSIRVDSESIPIAILSATSGLYYKALGGPGTTYTFSLLPGTMGVTCPSGGVVYDTILPTVTSYPAKYMGINCTSMSTFDLSVTAVIPVVGNHDQWGHIYVRNNSCLATNAILTLHYSPKYSDHITVHNTPASSSLGVIAWDLTGLTLNPPSPTDIYFEEWSPYSHLIPIGDTVNESIDITPITGDANPTDNICIRIDTVKAGCDPNFITVLPNHCFISDTQLKYAIHFENTGNDTAHNIYIMDTLSNLIDINSLRIEMASADMDIYLSNEGGYKLAKFDFPNINLLDSSNHGLCDGLVVFTVKLDPALPDGTIMTNRAGIYFDDNDVVMTNSVENIKGCFPDAVSVATGTHKIDIYPNPATDDLTIKMDDNAYSSCTITNNVGQVFITQQLNKNVTKINVHDLPPGLYYITVKGDNGSKVQKFVKM